MIISINKIEKVISQNEDSILRVHRKTFLVLKMHCEFSFGISLIRLIVTRVIVFVYSCVLRQRVTKPGRWSHVLWLAMRDVPESSRD